VLRIYGCLLPLAALASWYLLFAVPFTASSAADLADASYGRPFAWLTQDLSRYDAGEYPLTIAYNGTRNWSDPIVTEFNWVLFTANTAIVCVGVTTVFSALVPLLRRLAHASRRSATGPSA